MGTQEPLIHIEAATLAGGDNNQDRYAYGDGWAFVLDGASSFSKAPPVHDGGWYAERLKRVLAGELRRKNHARTTDIVARAIDRASAAHDAEAHGPCPTSTIAMARWGQGRTELYVLGDSCAVALSDDGRVLAHLTDSRIARFGAKERQEYRRRLQQGTGFDAFHRHLLQTIQMKELAGRNREGGYWIAGDAPAAARQGVTLELPSCDSSLIILSTDGIRPAEQEVSTVTLGELEKSPMQLLCRAHEKESADPCAQMYPRSKAHDDKTIIVIRRLIESTPI